MPLPVTLRDTSYVWTLLLFMFTFLFFSFVLTKFYRYLRLRHYEVQVRDVSKGHRWFMVEMFAVETHCAIGHYSISHGAQCDSCSVCVDDVNMKKADKLIPCKPLSEPGRVLKHHLIHGNIPYQHPVCVICSGHIEPRGCLWDYWCSWCKRPVHEDCVDRLDIHCDLGKYQTAIVPPDCVTLKWVRHAGRRHLIVSSVKHPKITNWCPIIVIGNRKSGNNDGEIVLREFRSVLNPAQVIDLCDISPESALEWCHLLPNVTVRILVAGGDGTVGWVLSAIEKLKLDPKPYIAILPLGTGNDLSRVLGWGDGTDSDVEADDLINDIENALPTKLDRWKIEISHEKHFHIPVPKKVYVMNNYMSIGVDALVTLNFHKQRQSRPWLFANRLLNKFCYFTYGTKDVLERECKNLHKRLEVELDGKPIELPEIEGIVLLNIKSWGGGCQPWDDSETENGFKFAEFDDKLIEVMGLYSSFHIAQLQVGLARPLKLGQAKEVRIKLKGGNAPMQVDGEPWEQHAADIVVTHQSQANMLRHQVPQA